MDKWWEFPRWSYDYQKGTDEYIEKAFATRSQGNQISCPCCMCYHRYWYGRNDVKDHIICNGFVPRSDEFSGFGKMGDETELEAHDEPLNMNDGIQEMFNVTLREGPNDEAKKFLSLIEEGQQELYPGCKKFSRLAFTIRLYIYKCDHKLSNVAFSALLALFKEVLPDDSVLPTSLNEAKKVLKVLGLDYKKIDACPNDCMLYWEEHATATSCHVCGASRWKSKENDHTEYTSEKVHKIPAKILRYFPLKKRLQRLYMCAETANYMKWHANGRGKDGLGLLQHPVDGEAWKNFDKLYPKFAQDPRNVRLALATDGFNPFNSMSIVHSTWPVILVNYNLPPWLATKSEFLILSLLIPGPLSPGKDIDIYLQPLIKDLNDLWEFGLETYDASTNTRFDMQVALASTISDFPAYAMVSGWSTKGKTACPYCHYEIDLVWLPYSHKYCYMCHRKFLDTDHPWRFNKRNFNGKIDERIAPVPLTGIEIEELLCDFPNHYGKKQPKMKQAEDDPNPWRKMSILFKLPYWKHCSNPHNLDVMHIEKNVFDNIVATLLAIPGKTKDNLAARQDLKDLREKKDLRWVPELEIKELEDGTEEVPTSRFWMNANERRLFCQTIKNAKLPQGYASNIARCVQVNERKITGYKSHDAHFMMHYLLPIAASITLNKEGATPFIRLSNFFKGIWKKTINPQDLNKLHSEIVETLCQFEGIFPPAFFDVMVHLPVHLVEQIKLGGPVALRCMYAIERYLRELKSDVRNKGRPEASMAEGFLAKECARFVARYLIRSKGPSAHVSEPSISQQFLPKLGHPIRGRGKTSKKKQVGFVIDQITWSQVHQYVLFNCNCEEVERYIKYD